jgi:hypothetical protein
MLALGSILPGERGNAVLRQVFPPFVLLMFVALIASTATRWINDGHIDLSLFIIGGIAGGVAPWVLRRMRRG